MLPILAALAFTVPSPQTPLPIKPETPAQKAQRLRWWSEARFGMFVHWGLYAIPAGTWQGKTVPPGGGEWILSTANIKKADYEPLAQQWNPTKFDARAWVKTAKDAGMKYIVITTKHHDGFGLWPSKAGDWNVGRTPFKRDVLKELAGECKKQGIRLCFYHSIMDWHHPDYLPKRGWDKEGESRADFDRYVAYLKAQLKELLTEYGDIGLLWFDGEWEGTWTHERGVDLYNFVRSIQPKIIVNNRVDKNGSGNANAQGNVGDYGTPEQTIPANGLPGVDWESCMTMNGTWGYRTDDHDWKSTQTLIHNLIDCASKGGNYLLNVGPKADGTIPEESTSRLQAVGQWMKKNGVSIYGSSASPFPRPLSFGRVTRKGNRLYVHVFEAGDRILLPGLHTEATSVKTLVGGRALAHQQLPDGLEIQLKDVPRDPSATVIEIDLRTAPEIAPFTLRQLADRSLDLTAADAKVHGNSARLQGDNVGYWVDPKDFVSWSFTALPGTVQVEVEYACEPSSAGSRYEIEVGGKKFEGIVDSTGSWSSYRRVVLGKVTLAAGQTEATVRALSMPHGAVMNLRTVRLRPAS